jgi:zinc transport system permease protein
MNISTMWLGMQWLKPLFMQNAFMAILLVSPLFGLMGAMVVANRMAFFSDALSHGAFTGVALGLVWGFLLPWVSAFVFSIFFAIIIVLVKRYSLASPDTVIGVFSSLAVAGGMLVLSRHGSLARYSHVLIGDILSVSKVDLAILVVLFIVVMLLWLPMMNHAFLVQIDIGLARSYYIKPLLIELISTLLLASLVAFSVNWTGVLLLNALLVLPAATARLVSKNLRQYHWLAILFALISGVGGLIISYYSDLNSSATIVMLCGVFYFSALIIRFFRYRY